MESRMSLGLAPKRRFSQNFLTDQRTAQKIADALQIRNGDHVLEIGPGTGALTKWLAVSNAASIVAVDLDERAIARVSSEPWVDHKRMVFKLQDVLQVRLSQVFPDVTPSQRCVIGNIPYAITSDILFWLFDQRADMRTSVIMMQREVARRCVAQPGTKEYGILSIASWYASTPKLLFQVQPGSFFPRPDVTSAVVRFEFRDHSPLDIEFEPFMAFVRAAFSQRRKVLSNALASWWSGTAAELRTTVAGVDLSTARAEQLTPQQLGAMCRELLARKGADQA
ncbi:MAG: ribosomal RNA small subunit methyltransferase A [Ignavibacteriae bacterium]|nr:MAG: ribosomal RNA small subunit methyltransferase A [Ignavibacteriota bacterium]